MLESPEQRKVETNGAAVKTLAIIPFRLLRGDEKTPLGVGLADALTIRLHSVEGLSLRPTGTVLPLAEKIVDPFELGRRLGVDYVLDGHILPVDERTRFSVQLLDIRNQSVLWASRFDETEADVFHLEDSISARIVELLVPHLERKSGGLGMKIDAAESFSAAPDTAEQTFGDEPNTNEQLHNSQPETLFLPEHLRNRGKFNQFLIAVVVFAVLGIGAIVYFFFPSKTNVPPAQKTLLVLPFKSENASTNSLGSGLADALSGKLGAVHSLSVLSSNAGREAAKIEAESINAARRLKADYVLRGSLQTSGERSELSAELIDTASGRNMFNEKFVATGGDLLRLQNLAAEKVLQALAIEPTTKESAFINKRHTENSMAYELYLVGRFQMMNRSPENLRQAIQIFNQAVERDPSFALPYVGIADCNSLLVLYDIPPPPDAYQIARENALRALALDSELSEAHASLGYVKFNGERNFADAEKEYRRAIELNPSYATTHHWLALALSGVGRHDEAIKEIKIAQKLDPTVPIVHSAGAIVFFRARRYEEALAEVADALKINPAFVPAHKAARWIYQAQGDYENSLAAFQKERSYSGATEMDLGWLVVQAQVEAVGKHPEQARQLLETALNDRFVQQNPTSYANEIALAYAALDDRENTLRWLEKAYQANDHSICFIGSEPRFDSVSQDPRFLSLVEKSVKRN